MADRSDSDNAESSDPELQRAGRLGRRVALGLYFVILAYAVIVGYATVLLKVYGEPTAAEIASVRDISCQDGYAQLASDLDTGLERLPERLVGQMANPAEWSTPPLTAFFDAWDSRYRPLAARCPNLPFPELLRLRHHLEISLRRFGRDEAPRIALLRARMPRPTSAEPPLENP